MLDKLRENSRSIGTYLIIGAIVVVFIAFFGQGSLGFTSLTGGAPSYAAKVNGKEIPFTDFQRAYGSMLAAYRQQMGGQFDEAMAEQLGLKDSVLDQLVERRLLVEAAKENGLAVSDAEVAKAVREVGAFQKDGQFDFPTYKAVLLNAGLTPEKFESQIRSDLLAEKMVAQIRQAAKATDEEVRAEYRRDNDKANLQIVRLAPQAFMDQATPGAEEIKTFLASEEGKAAVEREYTEKSFRFRQPRRVKAQHILVKVDENAPADVVEAAEKKLRDARAQIEAGADFGEIAKQISEDPGSKDMGGDLGFFGPGTMAKPFEDAAMALEKGQISDVVRTRFGMHLIKVNDIQEAKEQTLAEVQDQLAGEILKQRKAKELARAKAEAVLAQVKGGESLGHLFPSAEAPADDGHGHAAPVVAKDARQLAVAEETGLFPVDSQFVPKIGASAEIAAAARDAAKGAVLPQVYEVNGSYVVAVVADRVQPDMEAFEANAEEYRKRVVARKENVLLQDFTRGLKANARVEKNPMLFTAAEG